MRAVVYEPDYNAEHRKVLRAFAHGAGLEVRDARDIVDGDVAVIFGLVKRAFSKTQAKAKIIERYGLANVIVLELGFWNRDIYFSAGWGGINGRADHCIPASTDPTILAAQGVLLPPARSCREFCRALVIGQVPWDVTVQDTDHKGWCRATVATLKDMGREVRFRPHPLAVRRSVDYGLPSEDRTLEEDLAWADVVVTWNSNTAVDAVLAGIPVIAMDPGSAAYPIARHNLEAVAEPFSFSDAERITFLARLAHGHWTLEDMRAGRPWRQLMANRKDVGA